MAKLQKPQGLTINFQPSAKQFEVWKAIQPGKCECGGDLEMRPNGFDSKGHQLYKATCKQCGSTDIPEQVLIGGSAGGGKACPLDSHIVTPFGIRLLRDLKVGDVITSATTGGLTKIIALHPIETRDYYRLHFNDGTHVDCSDNHIWRGHFSCKKSEKAKNHPEYSAEYGDDELILAHQLYEWYRRKEGGMYKRVNFIIPLCKPVMFAVSSQQYIHPYVAGAMIANGCITQNGLSRGQIIFATMDEDVIDHLIELGASFDKATSWGIGWAKVYACLDNDFIQAFIKSDLGSHGAADKIIPTRYKLGTIQERIELIQGMMDCGGSVDEKGCFSYWTESPQLAEDFVFVIRSLGGVATISKKSKTDYNNKDGKIIQTNDVYNILFRIENAVDLFYCRRKKEKARYGLNGGESEFGKRVIDVEYIGKKEGRCITVQEPSGLYLTNDFTVTHNSFLGCCWLISSCIRFEGIRMVVARRERAALINSTWRTLNDVLFKWGLKRDVHYHIDNLRYAITFWNRSEILAMHLTPSPQDPDFQALGSLEITGSFIDEVSEVPEKAVEILSSRIRYKVDETFVVGKNLMSCNPSLGWVRDTFVMDENHDPVKLPSGYRYIPFSLFDNPDDKFRAIYYNKLIKLRNKADRDRLLYGNWEFTEKNTQAAYWNFDGERHLIMNLQESYYDPLKPLILSWDFNVAPYMSCLPLQIDFDEKKIYIFTEYVGYPKDKLNNTPAMATWVASQLLKRGHVGGILLTGDSAGLERSTQTQEGTNNYTIIKKAFQEAGLRPKIQLLNKQPSHVIRLEFVNELLKGYNGWQIMIDARCHRLIEDFSYQKKNPDGTKEKKKVVSDAGVRVEKWGHFSDCFDYALVYYLNQDYIKYKTATNDIVTTIDMDTTMYGEFEY